MRKKRENGMAKESGMGDFPRKQFESVLLHSLRIMDQNREYLQMHLARTGDERTRQALEDMGQESIRLERTLREMMGLLEVEMNDKPSMKPVDLCWILMEAAQIAPEIDKQLGIRLTVITARSGAAMSRRMPRRPSSCCFICFPTPCEP